MKKLLPLLGIFLIPIVMLTAFSLFGTGAEISGNISDENANPVKNVKVVLMQKGSTRHKVLTDIYGDYTLKNIQPGNYEMIVEYLDFKNFKKAIRFNGGEIFRYNFLVSATKKTIELIEVPPEIVVEVEEEADAEFMYSKSAPVMSYAVVQELDYNTEEYDHIEENGYQLTTNNPLSTFSIDVDGASYANTRRFIKEGTLPPTDAVRIEELINYFSYDYEQPVGKKPFSSHTELSVCPWDDEHYILHIGIQGMKKPKSELPKSNLVFLLDVSGSMDSPDKLGLVKKSMKMLVNQLNEDDRIAIVVYAGSSGLVLPSTPVRKKDEILHSLEKLRAGGSTAGAEGIQLAYKIAEEHFIKNGNNRVILCTDGDFNVGISSQGELVRLIEEKRKTGVFLSVFGFGAGNLKDSKMEQLANHGNGNYNYIDNLTEAQKVFVNETGGTLLTIAKDVKIQMEFNPGIVGAYRLIGYENRLLDDQDFNNDKKDAGEIGAGHSVTVLYEIIPKGKPLPEGLNIDELKYQEKTSNESFAHELATLKIRYKEPKGESSSLIEKRVEHTVTPFGQSTVNMKFSASVAAWGMLLRNSDHKGNTSFDKVIEWGLSGRGSDEYGYRGEYIQLVRLSKALKEGALTGSK